MTTHTAKKNSQIDCLVPPIKLFGVIEEALAHHPVFGSSGYIFEQLYTCYLRRLAKISETSIGAAALLKSLRSIDPLVRNHVVGNTIVRCSIQHALASIQGGLTGGMLLEDCELNFRAINESIASGSFFDLFNSLNRLGGESYHGWIWDENYPDKNIGKAFRDLVYNNYNAGLCTLTSAELENLTKGEALLRTLVPMLAPNALSHANFIGFFSDEGAWKSKSSSSQYRLAGTIFVNRKLLRSPWLIAEHLLHEALHQKLYDLRHTHSLFKRDIQPQEEVKVWSPWNAEENSNRWDSHRTLAAFHVYVHLSLLSRLAELNAGKLIETYGPIQEMIESKRAIDRARYLGEQLKTRCWHELGDTGRKLVAWLLNILDILNPNPPPPGAYCHHVLDLYQRETNHLKYIAESYLPVAIEKLSKASENEIAATQKILACAAPKRLQNEFNSSIMSLQHASSISVYAEIRKIIYKVLMAATSDGYELNSNDGLLRDNNELVKNMVFNASQELYSIIHKIPREVMASKSRARELKFKISCTDQVGRLLAMFASAVPSGGRILEIGTGAGTGTAWINSAIRKSSDVDIVTIEMKQELSRAASENLSSAKIKFIVGDALTILEAGEKFDMVFADASPIKYDCTELIISSLNEKGVLIIDDLNSPPGSTELQDTLVKQLRDFLLYHPNLNAHYLDWASGVIIAVKI